MATAPFAKATEARLATNRLIRMTTTFAAANHAGVPRQRLDFVYDSQGRRVSKTVSTSPDGTTWTVATNRRFLYDGWNLIAEYEGSVGVPPALTATYLWGLDLSGTMQGAGGVGGLLAVSLITNNSITNNFPSYDGNGNISAWISSTGTLLARMDYSPFGQLIAHYKFATDTILSRLPFGFSTKYTDPETGLLYYGHRYYDPVHGRWCSRDPIEEEGGVNLYGFVGNDGVDRIDQIGMVPRRAKTPYPDMHAAAHTAGKNALLEAEKDYKELLDKKNAPNATADDRKFSEPRPAEHGGRICEHCVNAPDGSETITYYATETEGLPASKAPVGAGGVVYPDKAPSCETGDNEVAMWHTHPSTPRWDYDKQRNKIFYWSGGLSFSPPDLNITDGIRSRTNGNGPYVLDKNHPDNPRGVPLFVTYRKDSSLHGEVIVTELYIRMPQREIGNIHQAIYYVQ